MLRIHELEFDDKIYNPFESATKKLSYLQLEKGASNKRETHDPIIKNMFKLDADYQEQKRKLYSYWDALGDVGGFHDGLALLISSLVGPFAAHRFFIDFVSNLRQDPAEGQRKKNHKRKLAKYHDQKESSDGRIFDKETSSRTLTLYVQSLSSIKIKLREHLLFILCRCFRKHKGHRGI